MHNTAKIIKLLLLIGIIILINALLIIYNTNTAVKSAVIGTSVLLIIVCMGGIVSLLLEDHEDYGDDINYHQNKYKTYYPSV